SVAGILKMNKGTDVALKAIREKRGGPAGLAHALLTLGQIGRKDHTALFESYLSDRRSLGTFTIVIPPAEYKGTTEVRDVALALLVQASGQRHADYGFTFSKTWDHMCCVHPGCL